MYSMDIKKFTEGLRNQSEILEGETEVFMDVQDLILKWMYQRSFEIRPMITTNFIEFIKTIITKYKGAPQFNECECEILVWSALQIYIGTNLYVDRQITTIFIKNVSAQVGQSSMLINLMRIFDENRLIANYHCTEVLDILEQSVGQDE